MKKFLLSLAAASTLVGLPAAANAQAFGHSDYRGRVEQRYDNHRHQEQRWREFRRGQRFDARYARDYRVIANPRAYHLRAAPRGQHWVRSGNNALLVGVTSGIVAAVLANAF